MNDGITFWFTPSPERLGWALAAVFSVIGFILSLKLLHQRIQERHLENDFVKRLKEVDLLGRPEEMVLREMTARYKVRPPVNILASLQQFDQIADQEIQRLVYTPMKLPDRIDIIEYLYSIRLQAFASDPSISGISHLYDKEPRAPVSTPKLASAPAPVPVSESPLNLQTESPASADTGLDFDLPMDLLLGESDSKESK